MPRLKRLFTWLALLTLPASLLLAGVDTDLTWARFINEMPLEVNYQILVDWKYVPARFYATEYELVPPAGFRISNYWTFEGGPRGGWRYHAGETLTVTEVNSLIRKVVRDGDDSGD